MPSQRCIDNVTNAPPPGNVFCSNEVCANLGAMVDRHCTLNLYHPDEPWILAVQNADGTFQFCSCCCSCFGQDTPIEATQGVFEKVQHIQTGQKILAAGPGLSWTPTVVSFASGMHTPGPSFQVLNVVYRYDAE